MMNVTLNPTPGWGAIVREQIRVVGVALRPAAVVVALVLVAGTLMVASEILSGGPGFDSGEIFPTAVIAFLAPFAVWRGEPRFGAAFLWTLPVDRRQLALARVLAGGVWMLATLAVFLAWIAVLSLAAGAPPMAILSRVPVTWTIAMYLFGSAFVLGLRHPLRWLLGFAALVQILGVGSDLLVQPDDGEWRDVPGAQSWFSATKRGFAVWETLPEPAQWAISTFLLFGAGMAVLLAAASRHHDRRRR